MVKEELEGLLGVELDEIDDLIVDGGSAGTRQDASASGTMAMALSLQSG